MCESFLSERESVCVCVRGTSETNFGSSGALWMSAMPCCSKGVSWIEQRCRATLSPRSRQTFHRRSHAHTRTIAPFRRSRREVGSESDGYGVLEEFEKKGRRRTDTIDGVWEAQKWRKRRAGEWEFGKARRRGMASERRFLTPNGHTETIQTSGTLKVTLMSYSTGSLTPKHTHTHTAKIEFSQTG